VRGWIVGDRLPLPSKKISGISFIPISVSAVGVKATYAARLLFGCLVVPASMPSGRSHSFRHWEVGRNTIEPRLLKRTAIGTTLLNC
jgi:hypothetical protein